MRRWGVFAIVGAVVLTAAASLLYAGGDKGADGLPDIEGLYEGKMKFKSVDQRTDGKSSKDTFEYTLELFTKGDLVGGSITIDDGLGLGGGMNAGNSQSRHELSGQLGNGHVSLSTDQSESERHFILLGRAKGKTLEKRKLSLKGVFVWEDGATQGTMSTTAKRVGNTSSDAK